MGWASITAVTDGTPGSDTAMRAAIDLGQRFGARVEFLCVANDPRELMAYVGEGMSAAALDQVAASVEAGNDTRREAVKADYKRLCSDAGRCGITMTSARRPRRSISSAWRPVT